MEREAKLSELETLKTQLVDELVSKQAQISELEEKMQSLSEKR